MNNAQMTIDSSWTALDYLQSSVDMSGKLDHTNTSLPAQEKAEYYVTSGEHCFEELSQMKE